MKQLWNRFWSDESGQGLVEYVLIIALVSIGLILVLTVFRNQLGITFDTITGHLENAPSDMYEPGSGSN